MFWTTIASWKFWFGRGMEISVSCFTIGVQFEINQTYTLAETKGGMRTTSWFSTHSPELPRGLNVGCWLAYVLQRVLWMPSAWENKRSRLLNSFKRRKFVELGNKRVGNHTTFIVGWRADLEWIIGFLKLHLRFTSPCTSHCEPWFVNLKSITTFRTDEMFFAFFF